MQLFTFDDDLVKPNADVIFHQSSAHQHYKISSRKTTINKHYINLTLAT